MGIHGKARAYLRERFSNCFSYREPETPINVVALDNMAIIKSSLPPYITTLRALLRYIVHYNASEFNAKRGSNCVFVNVDRPSHGVKALICHTDRAKWRCAACEAYAPGNDREFDPACAKKCVDKQPLRYEDGPHLPESLDDPLPVAPDEWMRFARDSRNLRRELYPRIVNAFLDPAFFIPPAGCLLFLYGFPVKTQYVTMHQAAWEHAYKSGARAQRKVVVPWSGEDIIQNRASPEAQNDADLLNRVYVIEGVAPNPQAPQGRIDVRECPEMLNRIHESDNAIFHPATFFPTLNHMGVINDGDAIAIGLLRVAEDYAAGAARGGQPVHHHFLKMPMRSKAHKSRMGFRASQSVFEYINLTQLYYEMDTDPAMRAANVANPVMTWVFLLVVAGTDFVKKICPGIGVYTEWKEDADKRARQKPGIWDTFFERLGQFSHLVQWNAHVMASDLAKERSAVIDETLYKHFVAYCYWEHFFGQKLETDAPEMSVQSIRAHCDTKKSQKRMPDDGALLQECRHVLWNLNYWLNAYRDIYVDPALRIDGVSYYGYAPEDEAPKLTRALSLTQTIYPKQLKVDETYKRHFYASKQKQKRKREEKAREEAPQKSRKHTLLEQIRGK